MELLSYWQKSCQFSCCCSTVLAVIFNLFFLAECTEMRVELTLPTVPECNSRCGAQTISHVILHVGPRQQIMEASCPLEKRETSRRGYAIFCRSPHCIWCTSTLYCPCGLICQFSFQCFLSSSFSLIYSFTCNWQSGSSASSCTLTHHLSSSFFAPLAAHCTGSSAFDVMSPFTGLSVLTSFLHLPFCLIMHKCHLPAA